MFVLAPPNSVELMNMLNILNLYEVKTTRMFDATATSNKEIIVIDGETREGDERLCEMAFELAFNQKGNLCPVCRMKIEETGEGSSVCGHLTFTSQFRR